MLVRNVMRLEWCSHVRQCEKDRNIRGVYKMVERIKGCLWPKQWWRDRINTDRHWLHLVRSGASGQVRFGGTGSQAKMKDEQCDNY